ncbi:ribonuclease H-like domain-containing protein [Tanacetum coccineum]
MLDRTDFASWQQRIRLYYRGKENGVNILKSIDEGPFQMGTIRDLIAEGTEAAQQLGLPKDIYTLINHYTETKDIWDNVKMLLEGSELTKEDRESQLYDDFEHFCQNKEETIHDYYVRFSKLINDIRNIKMTMSRMQLNSKFVNNMLPEWGCSRIASVSFVGVRACQACLLEVFEGACEGKWCDLPWLPCEFDLSRLATTLNRLERQIRLGSTMDQDDEIPPPPPPLQTPIQQAPNTVSTIKLPILKKVKYDIWAMKMEHYLSHTDYPIWEVIQKGNGHKARTTLLMALPEDHLAKFHKMTDAKDMWDAIKSRFGKYLHKGYDRIQSLLRSLEIQVQVSHRRCHQKFLSSLPSPRVFESDIKGSTRSSSSAQNVAFISSESTNSTNNVSTAYGVSTSSGYNSQRENSSSYTDELIDLKKFYKKTERSCIKCKEPVGLDKIKSNANSSDTEDYPQRALKNKGIVDSGCSRHMTGNKAYLAEYQDCNGGPVAFGGSKGYITGKGKIKTGKLDFEDVCSVKELQHFNLFFVSQMCDKKNKVLFTNTECLVLSFDFKLTDENQVLLKIPRQNNMYSFNIENIVTSRGLACLIAKATIDESNKWHRRFSWVFFLRTKDETSGILKDFIRQIENQLNQKVKTIRCDNGTEFKNKDFIEFCGSKGIKREYSNARTPQQNGVAERKNKTLIEAARTMLADSFLPNTF